MKAGATVLAAVGLIAYLVVPYRPVQAWGLFQFIIVFASWLWSRRLRESFAAERTVRELRVPRNDRLELVILATNRSRLPLYSVYFADSSGMLSVGADDARWLVTIPPRATVPLRYSIAGSARGEYEVGPFRLRGSDPLALFPFETRIDDRARVLVLPARIDVPIALDSGVPQGAITLRDRRYEDVTLYRSIRDYRSGDELKRINWKVTARLGRLCTNEYLDSLNCPLMIFCDLAASRYPLRLRRDIAERAIETAAAIVSLAAAHGQECGFASSGSGKPYVKVGSSRAAAIIDTLARIDLAQGGDEDASADRELFARARASLAPGGRLLLVGPADPAEIAGAGVAFSRLSELLHETRR